MDTCICVAESLHCSPEAVTVLFLVGYLSVVQLLSHVLLFAIPWIAARRASLSFTVSQRFLKLMSIELMMPSNHLFFDFFYDLLVIQKRVI